jgi:hypothetical protein
MKNARCLLTAILVCTLAGCYTRTQSADKVEFTFAGWVGVSVILGGLLAVPIGWFVRRWKGAWGFMLMIMGPVLLLIVGPAMYSDRVFIDRDHFEARYGFWFNPTTHSIRFADLREIRYVGVPGRRGRVSYQLHCITKNGATDVVSAGDLVRNAVPEILNQAAAHGVPVFNERQ